MKIVLSNHKQVAEYWANNVQEEGRASRMFFKDGTIYSYGYHFPIAKKLNDGIVLFTLASYSISTAKHISYVSRVVTGNVIYAYDLESKDKSLRYWFNEIDELVSQIQKPSNRKFEGRVSDLKRNARQLKAYVDYFDITIALERTIQMEFILNNKSSEIATKLREK